MKFWTITTLIYMLLIIYLSHIPQEDIFKNISGPDNFDLFLHFIEYSILGFLLFQSLDYDKVIEINSLYGGFMIGILFGISDELHQSFVPGRHCSLMDVIFDSIGVLFGTSISSRFPSFS